MLRNSTMRKTVMVTMTWTVVGLVVAAYLVGSFIAGMGSAGSYSTVPPEQMWNASSQAPTVLADKEAVGCNTDKS